MDRTVFCTCALFLAVPVVWGSTCGSNASQDTLNYYAASGFSCTLDGLTFSDFSYMASAGLPADSSIVVTPVNDGTDIGFIFSGMFSSAAMEFSDALLSYTITAVPGQTMTGDTVTLNKASASGNGAFAAVGEGICTGVQNGAGACLPAGNAYSLLAFDSGSGGGGMSSDSVSFATPATTQTVMKNIVTEGGLGGSASVTEIENTTQVPGGGGNPGGGPVPEPGPLLTLGSGLIGLSMLIRRRIRKGL